MAKNLKQHTSPRRVSRIFCGGLGLALFGVLGAAPALWGQGDELGEDFISDIFMEASEGMSLEPDSVPPPPGSAPEEAVPPPPLPPVPVEESVPAEPLPLPTGAESAPVVAEPPAAVETPPVASEQPPEAEPLPEPAPTPAVTEERPLPQIPPEPAATPPPTAVKKTAGKPPLREQPQAAAQTEPPADEAVQTAPAQTAQAEPKKAGKPPQYDALGEMPTATLEPASQASPTEAAPPPADSAAGERPLPIPPGEGTNVAATGDDYFLGPDELAEGVETSANSIAMPINLGALPSLEWETTDPSAPTATFISNSPLPQFDSSESGWKQLEVGQAETVTPPPPSERPASVSTVTQGEAAPPSAATPPTPAAAPNTDREQLRSLFSDMLPPPAQGARPPAGTSPPPQPPKTAKTGGKGTPPPPAETKTEPSPTPPETPAAPNEPAPAAPAEEEDMGGSAILRAGGQLTVAGHFGEAAILPPLEDAPDLAAWMEAQKDLEEQKATPAPEKGQQPDKTAPPKKAAASAPNTQKAPSRPAAPIVRSPLSLINETGSDRMLEIYRSVLGQMGYRIVSVETRPPAAPPTGETIILYRPGLRARARAVAGHLPGRKTLVETAAALPTEISILLR